MTPLVRGVLIGGYVIALAASFVVCQRLGAGRLGGADGEAARVEDSQRAVLTEVRSLRERRPQVQQELQSFADRTLGSTLESVDGTLRARLNRLGESEGLKGLVVGTGAHSAKDSPAKSTYGRSAELRGLRDEVDFVTLQAWINGEGTVDQVFRLLQRVEAEPWLNRIESVRLEAVRTERRGGAAPRIKLNLGLSTIFLPGHDPESTPASEWSAAQFAALKPLTEASLFAVPAPPPPPPVVATAPPPEPPAPPPAFPYGDWLLSGVAEGPGGPEVWLLNRASQERRVLTPGETLHELVLAGASGERATFTIAGRSVTVGVGEAMRAE